ncbi:hypothetical protein [Flavobacterium foetidum]|uniref:hypothetical protein n=1 Tax=Flavobacterium foetidum TaxID=2026681 RepID=UPI0010753B53|nr:hypothetical protein [Flavobacterium foetidum]KAF2516153.1 hypothetical protein E0W73_07820 [Flavobacterium foetidum]
MEFNFDTFFGYEQLINNQPDIVMIYSFAGIVFGILALIFLAIISRKLGLHSINSFIINPLMLVLGLTFIVSILPTFIFYVAASDISFVKIVYSWIVIFIGMLFFVGINLETIKKCLSEFGKITEQQEFRNRNR